MTASLRPCERVVGVVVVDDHALIREGLAHLLAPQADLAFLGAAADSASALALIDRVRPDVAVVDVSLAEENGLELVRAIRERHGSVGVLVLSMYDESVLAERALRAGAFGYVMKRERPEEILRAIRGAASGKIHVSASVTEQLLRVTTRAKQRRGGLELLSAREAEVFGLIGRGLSTREIARALSVSVKTVETHRAHIKDKLGVTSATQLVVRASEWVRSGK